MSDHEIKNSNSIPQPVFSIFDRKLLRYLPPFTASTVEDGKRQFSNLVNYSNSTICRFPDDYDLVLIGNFYDDLGFINVSSEEIRINGADIKKDDTIKYDELLNEIKTIKLQTASIIEEYKQIDVEYSRKLRHLDDKFKELTEKSVELYNPISPVQKVDRSFLSKCNILDKLFTKS